MRYPIISINDVNEDDVDVLIPSNYIIKPFAGYTWVKSSTAQEIDKSQDYRYHAQHYLGVINTFIYENDNEYGDEMRPSTLKRLESALNYITKGKFGKIDNYEITVVNHGRQRIEWFISEERTAVFHSIVLSSPTLTFVCMDYDETTLEIKNPITNEWESQPTISRVFENVRCGVSYDGSNKVFYELI